MSFEIRPLDITEFKGDAIVNSLGVGSGITVYGAICKNIINKADRFKLPSLIEKEEPNAKPCHMFETSGFNLNAKKIIHICTPHFIYDNQLFALEHAYKSALVKAYENKWYRIAFPIMGTGANRYPRAYVLKMITKIMETFCKLHSKMKVTLCVPVKTVEEYNEEFDRKAVDEEIKRFFEENSKLEIRDFEYDSESFKNLESFVVPNCDKYSSMSYEEKIINGKRHVYWHYKEDPVNYVPIKHSRGISSNFISLKKALLDSEKRNEVFDMMDLNEKSVKCYIDTYIDKRFETETDRKEISRHVNEVLSGSSDSTSLRAKHGQENKRTTISLSVLMRYILALHMTMKEANDLLLFCGKAFSPIGKDNEVYQYLIRNKKYVTEKDDMDTINGVCDQEGVPHIFFNYAQ